MNLEEKTSSESFRKPSASLQDDLIVHLKQIAEEGDFVELPP
ncbi:MAG: hypothetical protein ACP5PV_02945 [Methanothrix sp.]